jgi:kynureninase
VIGSAGLRSRSEAQDRDDADPLASLRDRFVLPGDTVYLDGNSLGALPVGVGARLREVVDRQWGVDLIRSWNEHGWWDLPRTVGDRIAPLVGAQPGEVVVCDSTSVNLFKLLEVAVTLRPGRRVLLTEAENFPTDRYLIDAVAARHGLAVRVVAAAELPDAIDDDVVALAATHVNYRTGAMHDLRALTRAAHSAGALALWDLSHSTGAVECDLEGAGVDLAVGCGYKYLNGGPGAPAFVYVARRHHGALRNPIPGWHGHAEPFAMVPGYVPAPGVAGLLVGTTPILSLAALDAALDAFVGVDLAAVRAKSVALTEAFIGLVEDRLARHGLTVVTPREPAQRGSQVCLAHPEAFGIVQALIARGVIGDYRDPSICRFGFAPLYLRFVDVWDAVEHLGAVLDGEEWRRAPAPVGTVT